MPVLLLQRPGQPSRLVQVGVVRSTVEGIKPLLPAAALAQLLRGRLFGISHLDPAAYAAAILVFLLSVILAAVAPASKALKIDPLRALRYE